MESRQRRRKRKRKKRDRERGSREELKDGYKYTTNEEELTEMMRGGEDICTCQTDSESVCVSVCVSLLYLRKASLAVSDVSPVFAGQAVRQFVLPDKRSVLSARAALQPSCTLGNNATHHLGYAQVRLQHTPNIIIVLSSPCPTETNRFSDPLPARAALACRVAGTQSIHAGFPLQNFGEVCLGLKAGFAFASLLRISPAKSVRKYKLAGGLALCPLPII